MIRIYCVFLVLLVGPQASGSEIPHLNERGQLIVDDKPFLILGGELGNSTASDLQSMNRYWSTFVELKMNTVLAPVSWDLIELKEGTFDFTLVDGLITQARDNNMRLVLLWFGSWKNSMSCYAPDWVKRDSKRFPRAHDNKSQPLEILTPFSEDNLEIDRRAFVALMKHLKQFDGSQHTVLMVQVENEIGMLPVARDHSGHANQQYSAQVPTELLTYLKAHKDSLHPMLLRQWQSAGSRDSGTWEQCFGKGDATDEIFMAWHYARYVEKIAAAGKKEYPLPMYLNAALIRPGFTPGHYPSGGPLPHLVDVWRAGAPSIDMLSPDFYFPNFVEWIGKYDVPGNTLFVPEIGLNDRTPTNALFAFGEHDAIGFSPFSIESIKNPRAHELTKAYHMIRELEPLIHEHFKSDAMVGVTPSVSFDEKDISTETKVHLGGYFLTVKFESVSPWGPTTEPKPSGGILFATGPDEFIIAGTGLVITFQNLDAANGLVGLANIQEGHLVDGKWKGERWLNGDQSHQGRHVRIPAGEWAVQRVRVYSYQ